MKPAIQKIISFLGVRVFICLCLFVTAIFQFSLMLGNVKEDTYTVALGDVATETIPATKTIEDTVQTEKNREAAEEAVQPIYEFNSELAKQRVALVDVYFNQLISAHNDMEKEMANAEKLDLLDEKLQEVEDKVSFTLTAEQKLAVVKASPASLERARLQVDRIIAETLETPIRPDAVLATENAVSIFLANNESIDNALKSISSQIAREAIVETEVLNEEKTERAKEQAAAAVEPTKILQGQIIVREGTVIDQEMYRQLQLLGVDNEQASIRPIIALIVFLIIEFAFLFIVLNYNRASNAERIKYTIITMTVYALSLIMIKIIALVTSEIAVMGEFIFPTAMAALLLRMLTTERIANITTLLIAATAGIMFQDSYSSVLQMDIALYILFGGFAAVILTRYIDKRGHLLRASFLVSVLNILFIAFYLLMTQTDYSVKEIAFYVGAAIASGLISGALTMGLLPFFESVFGILSTIRLIELSNPNHPLMKRLLLEAPGTYHHSVMVGNLAETACEAVGANGLLARVGCYYHDVGKLVRPAFFIENQLSINPHDSLPPAESAAIIIAHTSDGAALLKKNKLPQEIIDIALQHHGSSLLKYFYVKAKETEEQIDEQQFRYPGPKPQTKEAAIISVADSVEAAVRSMKQPDTQKIRALVQAIIRDRIEDQQFDECDITLKELKAIEVAMCETLNGMFHSRIEYPKEALQQKEKVFV